MVVWVVGKFVPQAECEFFQVGHVNFVLNVLEKKKKSENWIEQ